MHFIVFPLKPGDSGSYVGDLIDALLLYVERGVLQGFDLPQHPSADDLKEMVYRLRKERTVSSYGEATQQLVLHFQIQQKLGDSLAGVVEEKTAARMNELLQTLGIQFNANDHEVFGVVMDSLGRRLPGLVIRAFDRDYQRESVLGQGITDGSGTYRIAFPASLYRKTAAERGGPDLVVRAFDDQDLLLAQSAMVPNASVRTELNLSLDADLRLVSGTVRDGAGLVLKGLRVSAFDRDLRSEQRLGEALTDIQGHYQIRYTHAQFRRLEKAAADLYLRVFTADGKTELAVSETVFNAPPRAVVDLRINAGVFHTDSEWVSYHHEIRPLMEKLEPYRLTEDDLQFLGGETGIDALHLRFLRQDAIWRKQQARHKLPAAAFYGLLRQGLPDEWTALLRAGPRQWRNSLKQAIVDRQVPSALGKSIEAFVAKLTELAIDLAFVPPTEGAGGQTPIGVLLAASGISVDAQRRIVDVALDFSPEDDPLQLWQMLTQAGVPPDAVRSARFAIEAHHFVQKHIPTLAALQSSLARGFGSGADLARLSRAQWLNVAQTVASKGTKSLPEGFDSPELYAASLADTVELAFPTAVVAHRLADDPEDLRREVGVLLTLNPAFDLLRTPVGEFMQTVGLGQLTTDRETLTKQLSAEVRVARLVPGTNRAAHMKALQDQGFDSAIKVVMAGESVFRTRMEKITGSTVAEEIFHSARERAQDITLHAVRLRDYFETPLPVQPKPAVVPGGGLATWIEMFGAGSGCFCPPCESAYGPAAYLMDLLEFLKDMKARPASGMAVGPSLLDVLKARRPDLCHLKLNCANAEIPLPYIDLVNELLERQIAGVAADAISTPQTFDEPEGSEAAEVATRLRALPDERNAIASVYAPDGPLQSARYPLQLPFERTFLQKGIYFDLIGSPAAEVLALAMDPGDDLYRARLGLSPANWTLLHNTAVRDGTAVTQAWGLSGASALDPLLQFGGERGLLARSGLAVDELFALVESPLFAGWALYIDRRPTPESDPCNIEHTRLRQRIGGAGATPSELDAEAKIEVFDLMHRVLRLRRALKWPLARLQIALQALRVGRDAQALDLVALSRLMSLSALQGVSQERLSRLLLALDSASSGEVAESHTRSDFLALLQLSAADHVCWHALGLVDPLEPQAPAQRLERLETALERLGQLRTAALDPAELCYLLRHEDLVPAVFAPREDELPVQLESLVEAIQTSVADLSTDAGPDAIMERRVAAAIAGLGGIAGTAFMADMVADAPASVPPVQALLAASPPGTPGGVVHDFIALAAVLPGNPGRGALLEQANRSLRRVLKTSRLLGMLKLTMADIKAIARLPRDNTLWLDFNALPVMASDAPCNLSALMGLVRVSVLQKLMPKSDRSLLQVIADASSANAARMDLENITGWGRSIGAGTDGSQALLDLAQTLSFPFADGAAWQAPDIYAHLHAATHWLQRHRLTIAPDNALHTLLQAARPESATTELQALARSRFANSGDWYEALAPAMDSLRIQQRDALLAHILHSNIHAPRWKTADDVYAHLLIDVQMGPCQLSSRIVQAHAAIQLFVQRCLMNLEKPGDVLLGDVSDITQWRQWQWMKNYRVWEAGRKVFLYPENWIEADLRDNKSPFFEDLENELLQDEITPDTAERAMRGYLGKLHEVARLDIRALYEESYAERSGAGKELTRKVIHMVGRTQSMPHRYFYRQRSDGLCWTPWQKIELSIDSDHLVLVVQNRRPMLFWPQFSEVQLDRNDPPKRAWDMQLNWSMREFDQWTAPAKTRESVRMGLHDRSSMMLRPEVSATGMALHIYHLLRISRPRTDWPLGYAIALSSFLMDSCTGQMTLQRYDRAKVLRLPRAVLPQGQLLHEGMDGPSATFLRLADESEPTGWLDEEMAELARELAETGGLGGAIFGAFFAAAVVNADAAAFGVRSLALLEAPVEGFTVLPAHQFSRLSIGHPYVLTHGDRPLYAFRTMGSLRFLPQYLLEAGHHAFVCDLLEAVRAEGLAGLYRPAEKLVPIPSIPPRWEVTPARPGQHPRQLTVASRDWVRDTLRPSPWLVAAPYPCDEFDFSATGAYGLYNWEVFFHIPLLLADRLSKNRRFEDAQQWFHAIFDPTDVSPHPAPQKFWRVKPLFREAEYWASRGTIESLEAMMRRLSDGADDLEAQVAAWRNDPFNPHLVARLRLVSYMKTVVQKYTENLTAWADSLFRRDTMESINEATQLYVLGNEILGTAPVVLPPVRREARSYDELARGDAVDDFSNVLMDIDTSLPMPAGAASPADRVAPGISMLYFCIPGNLRLHELRTTIADRLFKIRHCMDIDGRTRQLALFSPPIDPALLVRARAAGLDIGAALSMALDTRPSHYRFQPMLQKALEFCNEVRSFGAALLSALEKRDSEQLAQLRAQHEVSTLKFMSLLKAQQAEEATAGLEAVKKSKEVLQARLDFYQSNLDQGKSTAEDAQISNLHLAHGFELASSAHQIAASIFHALPTGVIGFPNNGIEWGGPNLGHATQAAAASFSLIGQQFAFEASMAGYNANYQRRDEEWRHQIESATRELAQIEQQIIASEIRVAIAERDQENHEQQIVQAEEIQSALRGKFSSDQLYSWMSAQLAALHYQSYRMAFDLAKQAEAAAHRELGTGTSLIRFDHWDGGKKGLLAGERLAQDLRRLELAYMHRNIRALEIASHVSLRRLDPQALWALRVTGECMFALPAWVFKLDFPGHHQRRIKSVSLSVPGVVGPYGGVNGVLQCIPTGESPRSIATSSGQNDAGIFQLDFRDERYLPFESIDLDVDTRWRFSLPAVFRPFDYDTIGDVVLHLHYTAREDDAGESGRRREVIATLAGTSPAPLQLLVSVRHDFPVASRRLREGAANEVTVVIDDRLFPYFARHRVRPLGLYRLPLDAASGGALPAWSAADDGVRLVLGVPDAESYLVLAYALESA
ncbi:neuraminidase-like domain-containing protein [Polaromonas sp.]|uniref:Tc toxin subunit A-related protein n=1 Tax=Polaromonas sp. TaxID=1869339 RepID=UPI00326749A7